MLSSTTLSSGVAGPGYLLGKGLKVIGNISLRGVVYSVISMKLARFKRLTRMCFRGAVDLTQLSEQTRLISAFRDLLKVLCGDSPRSSIAQAEEIFADLWIDLDESSYEDFIDWKILCLVSAIFALARTLHRLSQEDISYMVVTDEIFDILMRDDTTSIDRPVFRSIHTALRTQLLSKPRAERPWLLGLILSLLETLGNSLRLPDALEGTTKMEDIFDSYPYVEPSRKEYTSLGFSSQMEYQIFYLRDAIVTGDSASLQRHFSSRTTTRVRCTRLRILVSVETKVVEEYFLLK